MNIIVPVKLVPDLVEELEIDETGTALDTAWLSLILNEFDDHAIEQAILLKARGEGQVTIVAPDVTGADDVLYMAAAKGADRLIKLTGDFEQGINSHTLAQLFATVIKELEPDLVLTGVQAHDDFDGSIGPLLAEYLGLPYVGYVSGVSVSGDKAAVRKEYPGGLLAQMEVTLPAVLGIQAAEEPPRYVPFSKVRQAMKNTAIQELPASEVTPAAGPAVSRMFQPEIGERAAMIEGDEAEIAARFVEIFKQVGLV